jgi:multiple sugar transport system permease protein
MKNWTLAKTEQVQGWLMCLPWLLGFLLFTVGPMLYSFYLSFTDFDMFNPPNFVGLKNYINLFTRDRLVLIGAKTTFLFTLVSVPLNIVGGLGLGLLLNHKIKSIGVFRTVFYIPAVIPYVATLLMWQLVFNENFGLFNNLLSFIGIQGPNWLGDPSVALKSLVLISFWGVGRDMLIYLGGLQGIPTEFYDSAEIDGANKFQITTHITIPLLLPVIAYTTILGIITSLQAFNTSFILTGGGPANSTYFYMLHIFYKAFDDYQMGYSSALSWLLFLVTISLTALAFNQFRRKSHVE